MLCFVYNKVTPDPNQICVWIFSVSLSHFLKYRLHYLLIFQIPVDLILFRVHTLGKLFYLACLVLFPFQS
jgi:hypothetical protein